MAQSGSNFSDDHFFVADGAVRLRASGLEAWIDALPLADVGETFLQVLNSLQKLNDGDIPAQDRFEALEMIRKPVRYLNDAMKYHFVGAAFPLTQRARAAAGQLYDLAQEMAKGYQSVSEALLELNTLRQDFTMLAASLHRALIYLGAGRLIQYQIYEQCGTGSWRNIHRVFDAAERKGVHTSAVNDPFRNGKQETSVEDAYKQILLLALANPYRYQQTEMTRIQSYLEHWTPLCPLRPADRFDETDHTCFVDTSGDEGPGYIAYCATPYATTCRVLETSALVRSLHNALAGDGDVREPEGSEPALRLPIRGKTILQSLATSWGMSTKRRYSRIAPEAKTTGVCLGLSTVHRLIAQLDADPDADKADSDPQPAFAHLMRSRKPAAASNKPDGGPYLCEIINESADGSLLKLNNATYGRIRVGELIAIRRNHESGDMPGIAVIRWLKNTNHRTVEFGIQLLSPDAFPVTIRHNHGKDIQVGYDYLKGLFIPEFKAAGVPPSLIMPAYLYREKDMVSLMMDGREHHVQLQRAIETTQGFSRFIFSSMEATSDTH